MGSDADITIMDPYVRKALSMEDLHLRDYSPWEGWEIEGWPATVLLRGKGDGGGRPASWENLRTGSSSSGRLNLQCFRDLPFDVFCPSC